LFKYLLFFPILLISSDIFILPQDTDYFVHSSTQSLLKAEQEVYIFSEAITDYALIQSLRKLSQKEIPVYIITKDIYKEEDKTSYLNLLKGINIYQLNSTKEKLIKGSLICIDDKFLYLSTQNFNHKDLKTNHAFAMSKKGSCKAIFTHLLTLCSKIK